jgi:DNA-directed RNA polymerase beta subunit/intein/homing endonuclease
MNINNSIDSSKMASSFSNNKENKENKFDIENDQYIETPWNIIESYFKGQHLERLVRHQLESYNNFVGYQIIKTIEMFNPVHIVSEQDLDPVSKKHSLEIYVTFENFQIYRPQIHENNGAIKLMFPQEARLRNFTYASAMTIDINIKYIIRSGPNLDNMQTLYKTIPKVHIGKLPIMLKSNICVLNQYKHFENTQTGECKFDSGGYFIINGSEKTVLGQERAAENRVYCFNVSKNNTKYTWSAEIKSVPDFKCISPKQINMMISSKNNGFGNPICVQMPRVKQPIPLFIIFRALGVISDKDICAKILLDINNEKTKSMLEMLQASIIDSNKHLSQEECIKYITSFVMYTPINMDKETGAKKKLEFAMDILNNDLFPHCHNQTQKIYFLGYMTNKLLMASFEIIKQDDRDSYINKRVDLTGTLLNNLFRNYFNKLVKDMEKQVIREVNTGSWKSTDDYENIINLTNIYKIIKSATIENGLKRALSTGDFGIKHTNSNKVGVAQVLNRLTYVSSLSHARRISTPTDKSGKLIPPRKLHNTCWGYLCPAECFDPETSILMWNGGYKRAGDIVIDDVLVDDLGNPTKVRTTCSGLKNMYDIIPDKSNFIKHRVTDNHILTLKIRGHKVISQSNRNDRKYTHSVQFLNREEMKIQEKYFNTLKEADDFVNSFDDDDTVDITIEKYLKLNKRTKDNLVLFKTEGIHWTKKDVEMDPYLLGMWLGDGLSDGSGFALENITDSETLAYWQNWALANGEIVTNDDKYTFSVVSKKNKETPLKKYLRKYNLLNNKHIPNEYLTNDRETRLKVLAGLIDTDGSVRANGHEIRICQGPANYRIIDDAHTLAMSLGFSCGVKEGKSGNKKFSTKELTITGYKICEIPTMLPRKKLAHVENETHLTRSKSFMSSKFNLLEVGVGPYVGWQLHDKRGRFCLNDGLVVHNTPEGASVGIVKNLSYMTHITIHSNSLSLYEYVTPNIIKLDDESLTSKDMYERVKVFINGSWIGISDSPHELYLMLKDKKYKGIINIYTSIVFDYKLKEIRICNDAGRLTRPLLRIKDKNILVNDHIIDQLKKSELTWDNLLTSSKIDESILEYIDPEEQSWSMIATKPKDVVNKDDSAAVHKYTHCEIHPSTIFGVLASCIPFPEHNQSPRNTYQCAQSKQAMGIYVTNYENRMDKTAYVLNYPTRPLVDTRIMNMIQLNKIPSGTNVIVAIMTHTGYNQEDSLLINQGSIDRGMALVTVYHTEKDEDKQKINGDEEIRCKPDASKTKGMKFGNYNKVNSKGVVPENTLVENNDIIISKITPIKENRNDHTKVIKFEDQSRKYKTVEETYIDKNYIDRNGEGYNFAKVRLRTVRKPVIGDKFCLTDDHDVLTLNRGWIPISNINIEDMVAQLNRQTNKLEYVKPLETLVFDHEGDMYEVETQGISQKVTLNHRMWIKKRDNNDYELIQAKDMIGKRVRFQSGGSPVINTDMEINFGNQNYSGLKADMLLVILGIFMAEGWTYICEKDCIARIEFAANKLRVQKALEEACDLLGLKYSMNIKTFKWYINHKELANEFDKYNVGAVNKSLPIWSRMLSARQSEILLNSMCLGDGHETSTSLHYSTSSIKLRDDVQILSQHAGFTAYYVARYLPGHSTTLKDGRIITATETSWDIGIRRKRLYPTLNHGHIKEQNGQIEEISNFVGKVYCLRVPSEVFLVRRNGRCSFTGNSSRHGQKGTVGNIIPECDMPFTKDGVKPDIIINPHAIPSRMTIGQLKETLLGKVLVQLGLFGDGTSFGEFDIKDICKELIKSGYESNGNELMYNGLTGEQHECSVFIGPVFYQRLKHMVNDKAHSRSIGPMVNLTRQPAEGRSRDGGLRFGEMERDCEHSDTHIVTTNGLSILIKNMGSCDSEVLGWDEKTNKMIPSKQTGFLYKGERECVKLTFEDGRTNICTPEHPILTSDNHWIKAKDLIVDEQRVKSSVTYPVADFNEEMKECAGWSLRVGDLLFKTNTMENYKKTLVLAKLIGYLITDGHIGKYKYGHTASMFLGHMIDVNSFLNDLKLLCNTKQTNFKNRNLYSVRIPAALINHIVQMDGIIIGKKVMQPGTLPAFILDEDCPKPIVREFLGGLFGGDGHTCVLGMHRGKRDILSSISFSQTKNKVHLDSLTQMMNDIKKLLSRFDINKVTIQNFKETTYSKGKAQLDENNKNYQLTLHLDIDELIPFHEQIGFRYCCHKSQRLEAGVSYKRLRNTVVRQHNWLVSKVDELTKFSEIKKENPTQIVPTKKAIERAVEELKKIEPLIHEYAIPSTHDITDHLINGTKFGKFTSKSFPTAAEYLKEIGALDWFLTPEPYKNNFDDFDDKINELLDVENVEDVEDVEDIKSCYGVERECDGLPTMDLKIIDIRPAGVHPVYDIEVEKTHSFLANGIVAHNCMVSHGASRFTKERMYDVSDKYSVFICKKCGLIASYNDKLHIHHCRVCDNRTDFSYVEIPYACKLLFQELNTMNIAPRLMTNK